LHSNERSIENIDLSLSEILPVYLTDCICQLRLLPASDKYRMFGWVLGAAEN